MIIYLALLERPEDEPAFIAMYNKFFPTLMRVGMSFCGDYWLVEDAIQVTWMDVAKDFIKILDIPCHKIDAYLATVMRNNCRDILRKERRHIEVTIDELPACDDVFDEVYDKAEAEHLVELIREMPETYREVLERRLVLGDRNKEIAQSLRIKESLVAKRFERGRQMLIDVLSKEGSENHV